MSDLRRLRIEESPHPMTRNPPVDPELRTKIIAIWDTLGTRQLQKSAYILFEMGYIAAMEARHDK